MSEKAFRTTKESATNAKREMRGGKRATRRARSAKGDARARYRVMMGTRGKDSRACGSSRAETARFAYARSALPEDVFFVARSCCGVSTRTKISITDESPMKK